MFVSLALALLGGIPEPPEVQRHPDAVEIFYCAFGSDWDRNFDDWPDGWARETGPGFPKFVKIELADNDDAAEGRALRIDLDGRAGAAYSPPIKVDPRFSYVLQGRLATSQLTHSRAFVSVTFLDAQGKKLSAVYSDRFRHAARWTEVHIGPFSPDHPDATGAVIGLHLEPGEKQDLRGWSLFDEVWFARLPRMRLETNTGHNVYTDPRDVEVTCTLSGILERDPQIKFELLDASSHSIAQTKRQLTGEIIAQRSSRASELLRTDAEMPAGYEGTATWRPPLDLTDDGESNAYGFYRIRVRMVSATGVMHERETSIAVIRPPDRPTRGEFGWSLPRGDDPLSLDDLIELLPHVGINWLKFPVWHSQQQENRSSEIMRFAERLSSRNIELVGILDRPPADEQHAYGDHEHISAANIFSSDPSIWLRSLDPVMTRLSLRIRWWQLGGDRDTSFVGYPRLVEKIREIKSRLYRFGQEVHLGLSWHWLAETVSADNLPWNFLTYSADPPLSSNEMGVYLQYADREAGLCWALVEPLPRGEYEMQTRARDLVDRMMAAKIQGADAIFVPRPFSTRFGLMNDDGSPNELLLPWRTTALALGGTTYLGQIRLPQGSRNHVFVRDGEAVMVIWNDEPTEEVIYLGDDVRQIDIWGRMAIPPRPSPDDHRQVIRVNKLPTFITGVHAAVAQWRMAVQFSETRIPSVFGEAHRNGVYIRNYFPQGVGGRINLVTPHVWKTFPQRMNIKLANGEELTKRFDVKLPYTASSGRHQVRIDFDINADKNYRFSVYRELVIGLGDVELEVSTHIDEANVLTVEQRMTNHSDEIVDFKCYLYAPQRRRQANQVFRLGRGQDIKRYRFANGQQLVGKQLWLRAEEINGQRILNYRIDVEP